MDVVCAVDVVVVDAVLRDVEAAVVVTVLFAAPENDTAGIPAGWCAAAAAQTAIFSAAATISSE